jgi:predicted transposase YbfD/YdcC
MDQALRRSLLDQSSAVDDPRQATKVLYPLPEIILPRLCATLAGADDFVEMALWGERHLGFLRRLQPFARGIPSHDTLGEVTRAVDPELFKSYVASWVEGLRASEPDVIALDVIAINGNVAAHACPQNRPRAVASGIRLGQEAVAGKSNEIAAIPLLLERLALTGALVTIDATGTPLAPGRRSPRKSSNAAAIPSWRSRPTARPPSRMSRNSSPPRRPDRSRASRRSMASMAGPKGAATACATISTGYSQTAAIPTRSPFPAWR